MIVSFVDQTFAKRFAMKHKFKVERKQHSRKLNLLQQPLMSAIRWCATSVGIQLSTFALHSIWAGAQFCDMNPGCINPSRTRVDVCVFRNVKATVIFSSFNLRVCNLTVIHWSRSLCFVYALSWCCFRTFLFHPPLWPSYALMCSIFWRFWLSCSCSVASGETIIWWKSGTSQLRTNKSDFNFI